MFHEESSKGEVSWESWKYEVDALINSLSFTAEQIRLGIRSLKRDSGDRVRRLRHGASLDYVLISWRLIIVALCQVRALCDSFILVNRFQMRQCLDTQHA